MLFSHYNPTSINTRLVCYIDFISTGDRDRQLELYKASQEGTSKLSKLVIACCICRAPYQIKRSVITSR